MSGFALVNVRTLPGDAGMETDRQPGDWDWSCRDVIKPDTPPAAQYDVGSGTIWCVFTPAVTS